MFGDEPHKSAVRELYEELGIEAKPEELKFVGFFPNQYEEKFHGKMFRDNEMFCILLDGFIMVRDSLAFLFGKKR